MPIRQHRPPTDEFIEEFQNSIVPSAIPSSDFIDWPRIESQIENYSRQIHTLHDLGGVSDEDFERKIADSLLAADDTRKWIDFYFELLGERGNKYSALEGVWKFYEVQRAIDSGDRKEATGLAAILREIGLQYIVDNSDDLRDHYRGMLVGMETHSRKNRQGTCFEDLVGEQLREITSNLQEKGHSVRLGAEVKTEYNDETGQAKTVDFAIFENESLRLVVEANAYKGGGSKPSEIRRSYNHVAQRMRNDGVTFVWITDGQGWEKSLTNVLRQSYEDIVDIYNLHQAETQLPTDIEHFFETGET